MPKHAHLTKPLDLNAPGAIDQLLAFHRQQFGNARMDADGGDGGDGSGDADADKGAGDDGSDKDADKDKGDADRGKDGKTFDEAYVKTLRDEAAQHRTEKQQLKGVLDAINKALNPDTSEKLDPTKLQTQLTEVASAHTTLQREHQVLLSALEAGADHKALLDSRSFLAKVAELDPTAKDFATKVTAEVDSAIKDNPKLKAARAAGRSAADHAGGSGEDSDPASKAQPGQSRIAAAYANSGS